MNKILSAPPATRSVVNRLIHGDCLAELPHLPAESVALLLTDPPYGNNTAYGRRDKRTIAGDRHPLLGLAALARCYPLMRRNAVGFFFLEPNHLPLVRTFIEGYTDFRVRDLLVWNKCRFGLGAAYRKQYELILALEKGKPRYHTRSMPTVLSEKGFVGARRDHPHEKPVALLRRLIAHASLPDDTVLDPFMGIGSTGVAARELSRSFIGIELHPLYVAIARRRIAGE